MAAEGGYSGRAEIACMEVHSFCVVGDVLCPLTEKNEAWLEQCLATVHNNRRQHRILIW